MSIKRISVMGCPGSGKSYLSTALAERLGLPLIHLDQHYWKPNWVESEKEEWEKCVANLVKDENWVMDGNYSGTWFLRLPRTELAIYLDYPLYIVLFRAFVRVMRFKGESRPDMAPGCPERFDWDFFHFVIVCKLTRRKGHLALLAEHLSDDQIVVLKSPRATRQWLARL